MRAMWIAHGKPDGPSPAIIARPYTLKDARDRLAEVSGDRAFANEFFDKYIEGREVPDYARLFSRAGLVLRKRNPGGAWVGLFDQNGSSDRRRGRRAALVAVTPASADGLRIPELVPWGSPAFKGGLEEADVITAADGKPITGIGDWQAALRARKPGDRMTVAYTRNGTPAQTTLVVAEDPALEVVTVESTGAALSGGQKTFREAWLRSGRKED
jgi:predicted metalloprotease with PDZ domain